MGSHSSFEANGGDESNQGGCDRNLHVAFLRVHPKPFYGVAKSGMLEVYDAKDFGMLRTVVSFA